MTPPPAANPASSPSITRRAVLHGAAAGVAAHSIPASAMSGEALDIAVIGGGVSGLHAAWRLLEANPALRVAVFEASGRIGGRLHSFRFAEAPHAVAEVGGMRFLSSHVLVDGLATHLGLAKSTFVNSGDANLLNLRGRSLRYDQIGRAGSLFEYGVSAEEQQAGPEALLHRATSAIVPGAASLTLAEWSGVRRDGRFDGRRLRDWSLRPALSQVLSFEETRFLAAASGYDQMVDGPNAADMLSLMLAHDMPGDQVSTLRDGYQSLPLRLADKVRNSGGNVLLGHRLTSLTPEREDGITFLRLDFAAASGRVSVAARKVILAMGRSAIESVPSPLGSDPRARALIGSVAPWPMLKTFLVYPEPWWRRLGIAAGRSVTDMPARQMWYFGVEDEEPGGMPGNRNSLLMTYCDAGSVAYWQALNDSTLDAGFAAVDPRGLVASEVHRQVTLVHGAAAEVPEPIAACYQDWTVPPYGGAVHHWQVGVESDDAMTAVLRPLAELDLFVCGEAYSRHQGWVEGALETAEAMLTRHFGLPAPAWLKA